MFSVKSERNVCGKANCSDRLSHVHTNRLTLGNKKVSRLLMTSFNTEIKNFFSPLKIYLLKTKSCFISLQASL